MPNTDTRHAQSPQEPSIQRRQIPYDYSLPTRREIAARQRKIRIARAVALIARSNGIDCTEAARRVGLGCGRDILAIRAICDQHQIPRKHRWGTPLRVAHTQMPMPQIVRRREGR